MASVQTQESKAKSRSKVNYPIYDCDHHFYEPPEAFLRHLPKKYNSEFQYVTLKNGRTKLAIDGMISDYIPNPGFEVVAAPGSHEKYYRADNPEGLSLREMAEVIPSDPAFHNGAAHLKLMDQEGIEGALIFPTLASVIEERLFHKPDVINALFTSLNKWVGEEYGFTNGRQFPVAAICLSDVDYAVKELEGVIKAGCKAVQIRPAPVPGALGGRSPGFKEFDPFWARCAEAKILVTNHVGDSGYDRIYRWWIGSQEKEWHAFEKNAFQDVLDAMGRAAADTVAAFVCHGVFDRHPGLRIAAVEAGSAWLEPLLKRLARSYKQMPKAFTADPVETVRKHLYIMPFYEDPVPELVRLLSADRVLFGSDWPHPEGLRHPLDFLKDVEKLSITDQRKVMSDNMKDLMEGRWN